ncbi:MAG: hypothetical protein IKN71_05565 [Alphaproteobacteria bacterium]|uniref:Four helix bundle protein n=1 Tax=virus sp. ctd0M1 TaxID=2827993 RepID=A0A8S5RE83_9VIRU|nr:hypothetical protein [Alphaproteobacteria bacterium]DAE29442.1 MAG TPA: hypothetical protein [virus sp. ctd0M1]
MVVYAKDRKETATQYIITAQNLQEKVLRYMMNEKRVPKKWRYLLAHAAIKKVCELVDNVIASNKTYPSNEDKLKLRKDYLDKAVVNCYQLGNHLQLMIRVIDTVDANSLKEISSLLLDEIELLRKTHKNSHIVGQQEV